MPSLTIHRPAFLAVFLSIIAISLQLAAPSSIYHELEANQSCRCTAFNSSCWPSAQSWQDFNRSIDGRLIALSPPASPCHDPNFNAQACRTAQQRWGFPFWRADQPGAMQASNWEALGRFTCLINSPRNSTCFQGSVATYAVNATESRHIQAAIALAQARNLRIVIKNTGHDYLGRSTAPGALMIWTHNLREIVYHEKFAPMGCTIRAEDPPAMTIGAGIQWEDLYAAAFNRNHVVVGGGSSSVGGAGGNPMGAGHGPLSPLHGLAADNVLELKLVTADGRLIVANRCQNRDLYWALRGGGGGTFGVVVSLTHRLYPPLTNIVYASYSFVASSRRAFRDLLVRFTELHPSLERAGWSGVFAMSNLTALSMTYLLPNRNVSFANATLAPLERFAQSSGSSIQLNASLQNFPSFQQWHLVIQCGGAPDCRELNSSTTQSLATAGILSCSPRGSSQEPRSSPRQTPPPTLSSRSRTDSRWCPSPGSSSRVDP
ncbi:uncharacterized FAD-linked oxidoreductase ARB_02478 [Selaginella moellendorffii]|uniref:uncharacterized FAD-linked oxidoreductase ARB_02478 n=1 Tax=Selaginella moellendorffii TaxID=88036 RepID=UPI000D1CB2D9|nr:uncharacterized FAD-linked oxidoreductase ARB_02478 [Selaginella moellendorffii]|eukprot:XP_024516539.1 uncharacterized FAD-linked oxidoreductase ARB_02478 [Selaginella moellendorffii]